MEKPCLKGCKLVDEGSYGFLYIYNDHSIKVLNRTGLMILRLCDGNHSVNEIVEELAKMFANIDKVEIKQDVLSFIEEVNKLGVLEWKRCRD
jgi:hypothetical protein